MDETRGSTSSAANGAADEDDPIDTSWIKMEPIEEELYIDKQVTEMTSNEVSNYDGEGLQYGMESVGGEANEWCVKRKHVSSEDPDGNEPAAKVVRVKAEPDDENETIIDRIQLSKVAVKEELDDEETDIEEDGDETEEDSQSEREENLQGQQYRLKIKKCAKCAKAFSHLPTALPSALQKFCSKCQPSVSITCKFCGKHFEHHKLYSRHVKSCSSLDFRCQHCKDSFSTEQQLMHHKCMWTQTVRLLRFVCPICSEGFEKNRARNTHKSLHVSPRPIRCVQCTETFGDVRSFQDHMDAHLVVRQFICTLCEMSFESRSLFDADQTKHQREMGEEYELKQAPDFVYVCKACKNWYSTMFSFERHECHAVSIKDPSSLTNVVLRALDFGANVDTIPRKTNTKVSKELPSSAKKPISTKPKLITFPTSTPKPAAPDNGTQVLDSDFTCHLCNDSFSTSSALGYHSCIVMHSAFDTFGSDSEDEDEVEYVTDGDNAQILADDAQILTDPSLIAQSQQNGTTTEVKRVKFSDIQGNAKPTAYNANYEADSSEDHLMDMCYKCGQYVAHNFAPCRKLTTSASYLCTLCLHKLGRKPRYNFKCSKCWQVFPTLARLHLHLPWHKADTSENQTIFKKPRLSWVGVKGTPRTKDQRTSAGLPTEGKQSANGDQAAGVGQQADTKMANKPLLSALLDAPVNLPQGVQKLFRSPTATTESKAPAPVFLTVAKPQVQNRPAAHSSPVLMMQKQVQANSVTNNVRFPIVNSLLMSVGESMQPIIVNKPANSLNSVQSVHTPPVHVPGGKHLAPGNSTALNKTQQSTQRGAITITSRGEHCKLIQVVPTTVQQNNQQNIKLVPVRIPWQTGCDLAASLNKPTECASSASININAMVPPTIHSEQLESSNKVNSCNTSIANDTGRMPKGIGCDGEQKSVSTRKETANHAMNISSITRTGSSTAEVTLRSSDLQQTNKTSDNTRQQGEGPRGFFLCYACNILCKDIEELKQHGCDIKAFCCHLCEEMFEKPEMLYMHKCKKNSFTCHMCNKKCSSPEELNQHPCIESNDIRIGGQPGEGADPEDIYCVDDDSRTSEDMEGSISSAGGEARRKASRLSAKSRSKIISWEDISQDEDFECNQCGKCFSTKSSLYVHKMRHNLKKSP